MNIIKFLFEKDKKPRKGLLAVEWVIMGYLLLTLLMILFTYTKIYNPEPMLWGRFRIVMMTLALWFVYRLLPCHFTIFCRVVAQMGLLSWWYPDTYELNRIFPCYDHLFAAYDQQLFGFQPALTFSQSWSHPVVSELLELGYVSYFPMIAAVTVFCYFCRYEQLQRTIFIIMGSFFLFYVIFIFLPVAGPQYYYPAVGFDQIAQGVFPNLGNYFETHQELLPTPGWEDGLFHRLVVDAHAAGERPTAAFPSSHVGIAVVLLWLAWRLNGRWLFWVLVPLAVLMFFATFYIQAHYVIDALAGLVTGTLFYWLFHLLFPLVSRK